MAWRWGDLISSMPEAKAVKPTFRTEQAYLLTILHFDVAFLTFPAEELKKYCAAKDTKLRLKTLN